MTIRPHRLSALPPFLVGLAAAVAAELAAGLLLYLSTGFVGALTVVLAVELGALGAGLWSAPKEPGEEWEAVRRRWLLSLGAFTVASVVAAAWRTLGGLAGAGLLRGLGLALLAAFPLYAAGTVLGAMAAVGVGEERPDPVGAPAALGAMAGVVVAGLLLTALEPASVLLGCVALLSAGAVLHGRVLDRHPTVRVLERRESPWGEVRVEERRLGATREVERWVLEEGAPRAGVGRGGRPVARWPAAVGALLLRELGPPVRSAPPDEAPAGRSSGADRSPDGGGERGPAPIPGDPDGGTSPASPGHQARPAVLLVGVGARDVARIVAERAATVLVEPVPAVAELEDRHLARDGAPPAVPADIRSGRLPAGPFAAVVLDASAWGGREPVPLLTPGAVEALSRRVLPSGLLVVAGLDPVAAREGAEPRQAFGAATAAAFPSLEGRVADGERTAPAGREAFLVLRRAGEP